MITEKNTAILILAAGASRRMNGIKQILPFEKTTLLGNTIAQAKKTLTENVFCILGANAEKIESIVSFEGIEKVYNENWDEGIGSSIANGVAFIAKKSSEIEAILIVLADQPFVNSTYLQALIKQFKKSNSKIIATNYKDEAGVPAIFPKSSFKILMNLNGDNGAKFILKNMENVELSDTTVDTFDVDYPSDLPQKN